MFTIYKIDSWTGEPGSSPVKSAHAVLLFGADSIDHAEKKLNRHKAQFPGDYFLGLGNRVDDTGYVHIPRPNADGRMAYTPEAMART